jgi:DNA-binding NarL/FixJ family response regulator
MNAPPPLSKIRILLVDDHVLMRIGLASAANKQPDMEVVAEAEHGLEAIEAYRVHRPDVVVLDLRMPKKNGIETLALLRREFGEVRVLILSNYSSGIDIGAAMKEGASGFIAKDMPLGQLLDAIRRVHAGEVVIPPQIARRFTTRLQTNLSDREFEVLAHLAKGQSNKEVAAALRLAEGTVKLHVTSILSKLGVQDRTQAILVAVRRGMVELE